MPGNSAYTCTWASLHCCQKIFSMPLLFMFCIHLWEGTSLPQSSVDVFKCEKCIFLLVFNHYSPTISIAEIIYEMQVGVFFTC
jgi:hypothetical protein